MNSDSNYGLFWQIFGGAIISVITLLLITVLNNLNASIESVRVESGASVKILQNDIATLKEKIAILEGKVQSLNDMADKVANLEQARAAINEKIGANDQLINLLNENNKEINRHLQELRDKLITAEAKH